jgi:hypothetical protein
MAAEWAHSHYFTFFHTRRHCGKGSRLRLLLKPGARVLRRQSRRLKKNGGNEQRTCMALRAELCLKEYEEMKNLPVKNHYGEG